MVTWSILPWLPGQFFPGYLVNSSLVTWSTLPWLSSETGYCLTVKYSASRSSITRQNLPGCPRLDNLRNTLVPGARFFVQYPGYLVRVSCSLVRGSWFVPWLPGCAVPGAFFLARVPEACFLRYGKFLINQRLTSHTQASERRRL